MSFRARQSIHPNPPSATYWTALDLCTQQLHSTCNALNNANITLMQGTHDLKRLSTVIKSQRVFDVLTETDVERAQRELASEMDPQIKELINRAEAGIEKVKTREQLARSKVEKRNAMAARQSATLLPDIVTLEKELEQLRRKKALAIQEDERLSKEVL